MGTAAAFSLCAPAYAAPDIKTHLASNVSTDTHYRSCKTLIRCADILENHDAGSFDYAVLARDFDRFGEKSRDVLWQLIEGGQDDNSDSQILANRALDILSRSPKILPPTQQRRISELWTNEAATPYRPEFLARIMVTNLSPMVRSTAVKTLASSNEGVASLSRSILTQTLQRNMKFPMIAADLAPLSRAVLDTPSPSLVALTALYSPEKSAPILARVLKSGDAASVVEAYAALYENDAEDAFKALIGTLYGLTLDEAKAVIGLGGLLAHRHPSRGDGFYMTFASGLSQDPEMSEAGRTAGFDALLRRQGEKGVPPLTDTPFTRANFALALSAFKDSHIPARYFNVPQIMDSDDVDVWLRPLSVATNTSQDRIALTEVAGNYDTALARKIAEESYGARGDYRLTLAKILARAAQAETGDTELSQQLASIADSHPITLVRAAASLGTEALKSKLPRKAILKSQSELPRRAAAFEPRGAFCNINSTDLRQIARAMPYYDAATLPRRVNADRAWLTSGARANGGWLAGYSRPGSGGLVRYDNNSGKGMELFGESAFGPQAVIAVHPANKVPLGQTAKAFWVFASSLTTGESAVYRAETIAGGTFALTRHAVLPAQPTAIAITPSGDITFAMGDINPPLTLSSNGILRRSCEPQTRREKTPS